jgi:hypothetical protein
MSETKAECRPPLKRNAAVVSLVCLIFLVLVLWVYGRLEAYCVFYPAIDTKFALGFSERTFSQIHPGTHVTNLKKTLGNPLLIITNQNGSEEWLFTNDGKCWWGDFAWLRRAVVVSNDVITSVDRSIRYD